MFLLSTPSPSRAKDPLPIGGANEVLTACLLSGDLRRSNPEATHPGHASSARLHDPHYLAGLLLPETFSEVVSLLLLRSVDALSQARAADFRRRCRNARKLVDSLRDVRAKIFTPRIADAVRDAVADFVDRRDRDFRLLFFTLSSEIKREDPDNRRADMLAHAFSARMVAAAAQSETWADMALVAQLEHIPYRFTRGWRFLRDLTDTFCEGLSADVARPSVRNGIVIVLRAVESMTRELAEHIDARQSYFFGK